jgi:hypothetical protein
VLVIVSADVEEYAVSVVGNEFMCQMLNVVSVRQNVSLK